jgi:hypothetical protein
VVIRGKGPRTSNPRIASWPTARVTAKTGADALVEHWRALGLPTYPQFDNDAIFQGPQSLRVQDSEAEMAPQ